MGYKVIGVDDSAIRTLGYAHKGAACPTFLVHELSDLAADELIRDCEAGFYVVAGDMTVGSKDPDTGNWILPSATPILITLQPQDVNTQAGEITESLSVEAYAQDSAAEYPLTYQWYSNNAKDYTTPTELTGITTATYAISAGTAAGTYYYFCAITANGKTLNSEIATVVVAAAE
jgi:hypothetical protein